MIDQPNEALHNNDNPASKHQCHHIFPDNHRCGSPRMRNEQFCYFHHDYRRPVVAPQERYARTSSFSLFTPSSHEAIEESLGELLSRIAANHIDARRAGLLLYGLQIAATNLRSTQRIQATPTGPAPAPNPATEEPLSAEITRIQTQRQ